MTRHHYTLRPIARPPADVEVLLATDAGAQGLLWHPGNDPSVPVNLTGFEEVAWTPAHMDLVLHAVGRHLAKVSVARPHDCGCARGWHMVLTVVDDV